MVDLMDIISVDVFRVFANQQQLVCFYSCFWLVSY